MDEKNDTTYKFFFLPSLFHTNLGISELLSIIYRIYFGICFGFYSNFLPWPKMHLYSMYITLCDLKEQTDSLSIPNKVRSWAVTSKDTNICCKFSIWLKYTVTMIRREDPPDLRSQVFVFCFPPFKARLRFKNLLILLDGAAEGVIGCPGVGNIRIVFDLLKL